MKKHFTDGKVAIGPPVDGIKMSEVFERFVEPHQEYIKTTNSFRTLLSIAMASWNVALFPDEMHEYWIDKIITLLPEGARRDGKLIVKDLISRKRKHFPQYKRMILDFEVVDLGDDWHISVVSTPDPVENTRWCPDK